MPFSGRLDSHVRMFYNILGFKYIYSIHANGWKEGALTVRLNMSRHLTKIPHVIVGMLLCVLFLYAATALAEEPPISVVAAEPNPKVLSNPGTVQVSISVRNTSDSSIPVTVTLQDPNGNVCTTFGSGGTASLPQGQSAPYTGSWSVSQKDLDAGRIIYNASFRSQKEDGTPIVGSKPITINIKKNEMIADLDVQRVPPTPMDGAVVMGETVVLQYQLKNVGTVELTDITITDSGIFSGKVDIPRLQPGETQGLSYSYIAGDSARTSEATITFNYQDGGSTKSKSAKSKPFVLNVTVPELTISLKADTLMVNPGTKVNLTYTISNKGNIKYEQIKITDKTLNDIESGITVEGGKEYTNTREVTVNADVEFQFTVTGTSSTGPITVNSDLIKIQTIAGGTPLDTVEAIPVELEVVVEADREIIYSEPATAVFHITVTNNGTTAVKTVNITERGKSIKIIPEIQAGASYEIIKRMTLSSGGIYQFVAATKDNKGDEQTAKSNEVRLSFRPMPTLPPPPATPTPTPEATDAPMALQTENPGDGLPKEPVQMGKVLLYILAGLLCVVLLAVGVLVLLEKRRSGPQASVALSGQGGAIVIDTIMRSPHRDYARAPKHAKAQKNEAKSRNAPVEDTIIVPSTPAAPHEKKQETAKRLKKTDSNADAPVLVGEKQREDPFRRPEPEDRTDDQINVGEAEEETASMIVESEDSSDYLGSIRKGRRDESLAAEPPSAEKKPRFDEDAALLSGSTGQYRLSRATKSSLPGASPKAQDPETFSRRQRAARTQSLAANDYYYEDDGDLEPRTSRKKRR